ncbi:MAG: histidinol-phosphatase HisJ [Candidatus Helarchaeota archaeon]|nr:histidinol-phosphatase HisJ [Candidatus Helarchaeota archaeon]
MIDYHIHSKLCRHGEGDLEEYVKSAVKKGLIEIGFCEHFPQEFLVEDLPKKYHDLIPIKEYAMPYDEFPNYVKEVLRLQGDYKNKITIKLGTEFDFLENKTDLISEEIKKYSFDYAYGSIHQIYFNGKPFAFDDSRFLKFYDEYDIDECYEIYLKALEKLISSKLFDVVSHLDLMKKYGFRPKDTGKYKSSINRVLILIQKNDLVIELNTAGSRKKVGEFYPEDFILKGAYEKGIEITLGSDAHKPNEVGFEFDAAIAKLKDIGFEYIIKFTRRKKQKFYF